MKGGSNVYTLPEGYFSKHMQALTGDSESHKFLVGATPARNLKENFADELHLVEYQEETNKVELNQLYTLPFGSELTALAPSPYRA